MNAWLVLALLPINYAWSGRGHEVVARLAAKHLSRDGSVFVEHHLPRPDSTVESALVNASGWADAVVATRLETGKLHFVHTPYQNCQPYEEARDCDPEGCIVSAMARFAQEAIDMSNTSLQRSEAIKFLIHLMADIHQPLHVGFKEDGGGNGILLTEPRFSLHEVWDRIPDKASPSEAHYISDIKLPVDLSDIEALKDYIGSIASETSKDFTCKFAYKHSTAIDAAWIAAGDQLSAEYLKRQVVVVNMQLWKAAGRLASLLNGLGAIYVANYAALHPRPVPELRVAPATVEVPSNRYLVLAGEFNEDELIEEEEPFVPAEASAVVVPHRLPRRAEMFEGVDLNDLVLIRDNHRNLIVTSRERRRESEAIGESILVQATFGKSEKIVNFFFDCKCFKSRGELSQELMARALSSIRRLPYKGIVNSPVIASNSNIVLPSRRYSNGTVLLVGGPRVSDPELEQDNLSWLSAFLASQALSSSPAPVLDSVLLFRMPGLMLVTTTQMIQSSGPMHARILQGYSSAHKEKRTVLVDKSLCRGLLTQEVLDVLLRRGQANNKDANRILSRFRPYLGDEIADLHSFFHGQDPLRWTKFAFVNKLYLLAPGKSRRSDNEIVWEVGS